MLAQDRLSDLKKKFIPLQYSLIKFNFKFSLNNAGAYFWSVLLIFLKLFNI